MEAFAGICDYCGCLAPLLFGSIHSPGVMACESCSNLQTEEHLLTVSERDR